MPVTGVCWMVEYMNDGGVNSDSLLLLLLLLLILLLVVLAKALVFGTVFNAGIKLGLLSVCAVCNGAFPYEDKYELAPILPVLNDKGAPALYDCVNDDI